MKVLFVINSLAPGGTEQSTVLLAAGLEPLGVSTTIVTMKPADHDLSAFARAGGTPVHQLRAGSFLSRRRELRSVIRAEQPDIVHTALFDADLIGRVAAWGTGVPVISSLVNTPYDPERLNDPNVSRWKLRVVQAVDAVTGRLMVKRFHAVSEGVRAANARALRIPIERIIVAERGRDTERLGNCTSERRRQTRSNLGIDHDAPVVLNLGRLEHQKAQVDLIRSVSVLAQEHPDVVVLIAGKDGSAAGDVREAATADPETSRCVRLLGHRTDVGDLLCASDVLVISSRFEGTAGVAIEAMACGTAIVATDVEGLRGVLAHDVNAVLAPVGDSAGLARAIGRVISSKEVRERLADAARSDYQARFTMAAAAQRMADFYRSVAGNDG